MTYQDAVQVLVDIGLLDIILPFLLVYTITFALLQRTLVLGMEDGKPKVKHNAMVAFVFGFITILATNVLQAIQIFIQYFVLLLIAGLLIALIMGLSGAGYKSKLMAATMLVLFGLALLYSLMEIGLLTEQNLQQWFMPVLALVGIGVLLYWMFGKKTSGKKEEKKEEPKPAKPTADIGKEELKKEGTIWKS